MVVSLREVVSELEGRTALIPIDINAANMIGSQDQNNNQENFSSTTPTTPMEVTPEWKVIRALIKTIYWAEGTLNKDNPYAVGFGFNPVGMIRHPDEDGGFCIPIGDSWGSEWADQCSSAAGAGQWTLNTWNGVQQAFPEVAQIRDPFCPAEDGVCEFSPIQQDLMMVHKIDQRGALRPILEKIFFGENDGATLVPKHVFVEEMEKKLSREWASIPCLTGMNGEENPKPCHGESYYGQGGKDMEDLWNKFNEFLAQENQGQWQNDYEQYRRMGLTQPVPQ